MRSAGWTARECGVRTEELPWARPGARHTRDFEDMVLWLAQRTDRTSVATLMRCAWETVTAIINRGVTELLDARRLDALYRIGVDEICYRHPHRYLTIIGDHDTGTVVDIQPGRSEQSLANFYASQSDSDHGSDRSGQHGCVEGLYRRHPHPGPARSDLLRPVPHHAMGQPRPGPRFTPREPPGPARDVDDLRRNGAPDAGRCAPERTNSPTTKRDLVNQIARTNRHIGRAWTLKEQLRDIYRLNHPPGGGSPTSAPLDHRRQTQPHQRLRRSGTNDWRSTSKKSSPQSNSVYPTPSSKASTPRSDSSTPAATATTPPKHWPR